MSVNRQHEAYEAVNGALHKLDFEFLGEDHEYRTVYWTRGTELGKKIRVTVHRSRLVEDVLAVTVDYPNWSLAREGIRKTGHITMQIDCANEHVKRDVEEATKQVVHRVLEIFADVLQGKGVAGPEPIRAWLAAPGRVAAQNPAFDDDEEG